MPLVLVMIPNLNAVGGIDSMTFHLGLGMMNLPTLGRASTPATQEVRDKVKNDERLLIQNDLEKNTSCPICLQDLEVGKLGIVLSCQHAFHGACILPWLENSCTCPICRHSLNEDASSSATTASGNAEATQAISINPHEIAEPNSNTRSNEILSHSDVVGVETALREILMSHPRLRGSSALRSRLHLGPPPPPSAAAATITTTTATDAETVRGSVAHRLVFDSTPSTTHSTEVVEITSSESDSQTHSHSHGYSQSVTRQKRLRRWVGAVQPSSSSSAQLPIPQSPPLQQAHSHRNEAVGESDDDDVQLIEAPARKRAK